MTTTHAHELHTETSPALVVCVTRVEIRTGRVIRPMAIMPEVDANCECQVSGRARGEDFHLPAAQFVLAQMPINGQATEPDH